MKDMQRIHNDDKSMCMRTFTHYERLPVTNIFQIRCISEVSVSASQTFPAALFRSVHLLCAETIMNLTRRNFFFLIIIIKFFWHIKKEQSVQTRI